ncbi:5-formyltetrahydrofolate cyclo-ligase [Corynebacterium accolens]|uniref:5-formyltetrahydrofolate cyclo-ligase n=1 Tax=Corynebacterium accolens TaxID=38284 RepID=UPI00254276AB|nr:5-formyltetrahydrofolate cyclo-ligase [Corynebacterium accolens]MDK4294681.1 5-formyltetrahydrofolate cyclo-ligase [Corynebacterium accolens]WKS73912.1 5-formyltetrahydrofolate cyclo-ligase [Corynebacterium accolens]
MPSSSDIKEQLRTRLLRARRGLTADKRAEWTTALREQLEPELAGVSSIAAYWPLGTEPGGADFIPWLSRRVDRVLLPITCGNGVLNWAEYKGTHSMQPGQLGISEPAGPRFDSRVLCGCDLILAPAMAIDAAGNRLGKGGGYYDRALSLVPRNHPAVLAMVYPTEFLDSIPATSHDRRVEAVVTAAGIHRFSS